MPWKTRLVSNMGSTCIDHNHLRTISPKHSFCSQQSQSHVHNAWGKLMATHEGKRKVENTSQLASLKPSSEIVWKSSEITWNRSWDIWYGSMKTIEGARNKAKAASSVFMPMLYILAAGLLKVFTSSEVGWGCSNLCYSKCFGWKITWPRTIGKGFNLFLCRISSWLCT